MPGQTDGGLSKAQLKDQVAHIVLAQGNEFIKELLRAHSVKIGVTKKDFAENIAAAIDAGELTQQMIEQWLFEIEGWGNQHVYLFAAPGADSTQVAAMLNASAHAALVGVGQSYNFPDALTLSNIDHRADGLSLVWHLGKAGWDRLKSKDYQVIEGLEEYRYEAYRRRMDRSVIRFEWRFTDDHCAILLHRNKDIDHAAAKHTVWQAIQALGLTPAPCPALSLTQAVKAASRKKGTKSARLEAEGGFVDLVSTLGEGGIDEVAAVRHARLAIDDDEFARAQGTFSVETADPAVSISVQVFGSEGRLRLWAQCRRDDVHAIIAHVIEQNEPPVAA